LQRGIDADIGHLALARLQRDDGERGLLHAHQFDIDAFALEIAERQGQIHDGIGHERRLEIGDDEPEWSCGCRSRQHGRDGKAGYDLEHWNALLASANTIEPASRETPKKCPFGHRCLAGPPCPKTFWRLEFFLISLRRKS